MVFLKLNKYLQRAAVGSEGKPKVWKYALFGALYILFLIIANRFLYEATLFMAFMGMLGIALLAIVYFAQALYGQWQTHDIAGPLFKKALIVFGVVFGVPLVFLAPLSFLEGGGWEFASWLLSGYIFYIVVAFVVIMPLVGMMPLYIKILHRFPVLRRYAQAVPVALAILFGFLIVFLGFFVQ